MKRTIREIRDARRAKSPRRRYYTLANGGRVSAALYWRLFWYFDVGPRWRSGRKDGRGA